jgi:hypothetical protein
MFASMKNVPYFWPVSDQFHGKQSGWFVRSEVFMAEVPFAQTTQCKQSTMKMTMFWDVAPCSLVDYPRLYGATSQKTVTFILAAVRT